ncbi:winged helix-turn-helix domain-containing protein [Tunturibacter empetritectus]|uniref:DNA-binding winged helix-turn-helix (WHTH) protein/TolB-like protein n=1 Tax=Tunturiibacter empetritectus TaxID=3069691 RepID=A0A7W8MT45_9BACT|nr:winged helix-turn-helix domain-containing protein [Edaphobacter lichenicola]MBB5319363.1 DNA-binding winged helix-turn-helix (wHTH) protein/TolB-like protein [Edaphobacter lichenicola]
MYEFSGFRFDPENHLLESDGNPISLTPKAFEILLVLVQNGSRLTTKEELMRKVWPDSFVEEANLTVNISALRRQLGESPDGHRYIETVPRKGYRFAVPVSHVEVDNHTVAAPSVISVEETAQDILVPGADSLIRDRRRASTANETSNKKRGWLRPVIVVLSLIAVVLSGLGYMAYRNRSVHRQLPRRLAVLPFQNLQQDPNTEFLGFSLADAVITKLGYVSELTVRPSYSVQKYRTQPIDIPAVAASLKVDTLLTGTFLREGDNLRIACQLIDVKTENLLWKGAFDLKYDKLLTVQDQVAQQIIRGLELTLSASEAGRLKTDEPVSPLAYEYYLRGVDLYSKGDAPMAVKMLKKSTELAPHFALSWANLGKAYTANASFQFGGVEHYRMAQAAFEKALSLEPDEMITRIYMANMFTDTGRVEKAVPLLRQALKTNPNQAEIHWELGYAYRFAGMLPESARECELARQLDPGVKINTSALNAYLYLGQYDRFLQSLPKTDDGPFIAFYRGFGEYYKKNLQQAETNFDHAFELDPSLLQAEIGKAFSFGIQQENDKASAILHSLEAKVVEHGVVDPEAIYKIAQAYATIGDKASALRVLQSSIQGGFFPYPYFAADPLLDTLRAEAEFSKLINVARQRHEAFKREFFF